MAETEIRSVLVHEMIHVYFFNMGNWKESHGWRFKAQMRRINNMNLGFEICISCDITKLKVAGKLKRPYDVVLVETKQNEKLIGVVREPISKSDREYFINKFKSMTQTVIYLPNILNPELKKYKISSNLKSLRYLYEIEEELYNDLAACLI